MYGIRVRLHAKRLSERGTGLFDSHLKSSALLKNARVLSPFRLHAKFPSHKLFAALFTGVALLLAGAATARAQSFSRDVPGKSSSKFLAAFSSTVAGTSQSTVRVQCDGTTVALGTVVGADGWILTKASELSGTPVCKLADGSKLEARLVGVHEAYDLALLKVAAGGLTPVAWFDSKQVPVGSWLVSSGTGLEPLAAGVVSVATRTL